MGEVYSDAFVFFGAHEDLAYKQIFPALLGWPKASKWIQLEKVR